MKDGDPRPMRQTAVFGTMRHVQLVQAKESQMSRIGIFVYGVLSYLIFLAVFLYGIGFIGGFLTPTSLDSVPTSTLGRALAVDLSLLAAFAI